MPPAPPIWSALCAEQRLDVVVTLSVEPSEPVDTFSMLNPTQAVAPPHAFPPAVIIDVQPLGVATSNADPENAIVTVILFPATSDAGSETTCVVTALVFVDVFRLTTVGNAAHAGAEAVAKRRARNARRFTERASA